MGSRVRVQKQPTQNYFVWNAGVRCSYDVFKRLLQPQLFPESFNDQGASERQRLFD